MDIESVLADTLILSSSGVVSKEAGNKTNIDHKYGNRTWAFERFFDNGPCVRNLICAATESSTNVCNLIKWFSPIMISFDLHSGNRLTQIEFPLNYEYIVSDMKLISPGVVENSKWWLSELSIDCGFQLVFGYEFLGSGNAPVPLTKPETRDYSDFHTGQTAHVISATEHSGCMATIAITRPRFLICISLVGCNPDSRFEPEGLIEAARFYPVVMIKANHGISRISKINAEIRISRHSKTEHAHDEMTTERTIYLIADRNSRDPTTGVLNEGLWDTPAPFWDAIFDYYKEWINQVNINQNFLITDSTKKESRTDQDHRRVIDTITLNPSVPLVLPHPEDILVSRTIGYVSTLVTKLPHQGEFDNIHISPIMMSGKEKVIMAPICQHDCLHTHFRWGNGYNDVKWVRGWDAKGPFSKIGSPLSPLNQSIRVNVFRDAESVGFKYQCEVTEHDPRSWVFIYHHGSCCAVKLNQEIIASKMSVLSKIKDFPGRHLLNVTPGNANFYYYLRYTAFIKKPRIYEDESDFYFLQKL